MCARRAHEKDMESPPPPLQSLKLLNVLQVFAVHAIRYCAELGIEEFRSGYDEYTITKSNSYICTNKYTLTERGFSAVCVYTPTFVWLLTQYTNLDDNVVPMLLTHHNGHVHNCIVNSSNCLNSSKAARASSTDE